MPNDMSFISYFASTTPESDHKRARLKMALFLQGSPVYDPNPIRKRLLDVRKVLGFELAIIEGKVDPKAFPARKKTNVLLTSFSFLS